MKCVFCFICALQFAFCASAQQITIKKQDFLQDVMQKQNDTLYILNFWATWCKPCVKELPAFEAVHNKYKGKKVKVYLVSLDFKSQIESRLIPFLQQRNISAEVIFLEAGNANEWIPKVSKDWGGAIPATLFVKNGKKTFRASVLTLKELQNLIVQFLS